MKQTFSHFKPLTAALSRRQRRTSWSSRGSGRRQGHDSPQDAGRARELSVAADNPGIF